MTVSEKAESLKGIKGSENEGEKLGGEILHRKCNRI